MHTNVVEVPNSTTRTGRALTASLAVLAVAALYYVVQSALPYYVSSAYDPAGYAARRGWVLLHIAGGMVALLTGPVQLWLGLADRGMQWHRRMGLAYMAGVAVGSLAGFYLAVTTEFGLVFGAALASLAFAWVCTTGMAFLAIKRSLFEQHKDWMIRSYVVTFGFVVFRATTSIMDATGTGAPLDRLAFAAWACWTLPLFVTELVLQGRRILAVRN